MTFRDFSMQCINYPYSKEYFEFTKRSSELELSRLYLESQEFITENSNIAEALRITDYFTESMSEEENKKIYLNYNEGVKAFFKNLGGSIIDHLRRFLAWIRKLISGIPDEKEIIIDKNNVKVLTDNKNVPITIDNVSAKEIINNVPKPPYLSENNPISVIVDFTKDVSSEYVKDISNIINFVASETAIINKDTDNLIQDIDTIVHEVELMCNILNGSAIDNDINKIKKLLETSKDKEIKMNISKRELISSYNKLSESLKKMENIDIQNSEVNGKYSKDLLEINKNIITIIGNTMKVISEIFSYRKTYTKKITSILKSHMGDNKSSDN